MRINPILGFVLFAGTTLAFGQVHPAGANHTLPVKIGLGYSNFNSDWNGRVAGPSLWMDWNFSQAPGLLSGFALEAQAHHVLENIPTFHLRYNTFGGGPVYNFTIPQTPRIRPYAGLMFSYGSFAFAPKVNGYSHDSRTIYGPTGGAEFALASKLKLRAGYDYQVWPNLFHHKSLHPNGLTIGTAYDFGARSSRIY